MIYPIVLFGDPVLRRETAELKEGDMEVKVLSDDMFETMEAAGGVGLAAPQIGKSVRVFVIDSEPLEEENMKGIRKVFVNPQMLDETGEDWIYEEGCLSIPDVRADISRKNKIKISYYDEHWQYHTEQFEGMIARIIQHEYDHLEGKLFTDYLKPLKRRLLKNRLTNISRGKVDAKYKVRVPEKA